MNNFFLKYIKMAYLQNEIALNYYEGLYCGLEVIFSPDGEYINATKLADKHRVESGKRKDVGNYLSNKTTIDLIKAFVDRNKKSGSGLVNPDDFHYEVTKSDLGDNGLDDATIGRLQGQYIHKSIIDNFKQWLYSGRPKSDKGLIYIITDGIYQKYNFYKIGLTKDASIRSSQFQTASPVKVKIIFTKKFNNVRIIERTIHKHYHTVRKEGEWFEIEDLEKCIDYINSINEYEGEEEGGDEVEELKSTFDETCERMDKKIDNMLNKLTDMGF